MSGPGVLHQLFYTEPAGRFVFGHVFRSAEVFWDPDTIAERDDTGLWHCDIGDRNRLTWSEAVYELFGLPVGKPVSRELAVSRYSEQSKIALERVRSFAIRSGCAFILDAALTPAGADNRWIRVLAIPIVEDDRVVGLHGLKRSLEHTGMRRSKKAVRPSSREANPA